MAEFKGVDFLVQRGDGATPTEAFTTVAGMRSTSMALNSETVDTTTKDGAPWRKLLADAGIKSMSISLAGVFNDNATMEDMITQWVNGAITNYKLISGAGDEFAGAFQVVSIERAGEYNGEETYSMTLESSGIITHTPAA